MPLPDERPRQSVANLIGKFEQSGKRGSSSNGTGVPRRQSQGVLSAVPPAMPLKAQYTGNSTSAISVQSGPRSPPIKASELSNASGTDVTSWRKTTALQATVPPTSEIAESEAAAVAGEEPRETTSFNLTEQKVTYEEPVPASIPSETDQVTSLNEPATPKPAAEKSTKASKPASTTSSSNTAKPKPAPAKQTAASTSKQAPPSTSKTAKSPPVSRPSTLSKATASAAAKSSKPSIIPPPDAPLKPQHTGGSTTASRLSAPTAASKARIAGASSSSGTAKPAPAPASSGAKPPVPSSSTVKRAATTSSTTTSPRKVVPKSTMASSASAPVKKAPLPRSTVSTSKPSTSSSAAKKPAAAPATAQKAATTSKAPPIKPFAPPRVGLAGAGRVKDPAGPAKLAAAGGLAAGVPAAALLVGDKEAATEEATNPTDQPQESINTAVDEAQKIEEHHIVPPEIEVEGTPEVGDETVTQESEPHKKPAEHEESALSESGGHGEAELSGSVGEGEGEVSMTLDDDEHHEEVGEDELHEEEAVDEETHEEGVAEETADEEPHAEEHDHDHNEPVSEGWEHEELQEGQDQASVSPPPSHTEEEPEQHASTPSEGGGDLEDVVALLEGGHPAQPIDLFSPGYAESVGSQKDIMQENSPNPSQREVGDIPDDD